MPGRKDATLPGASFISDWEIYRAGIVANDVLVTPLLVTATIDLSRNDNGLTNQIWVYLNRTVGAGTVILSLFRDNTGSWAEIVPIVQEGASTAALDNLALNKFTGLVAANYRVLVTAMTAGAHWTLHVAHT